MNLAATLSQFSIKGRSPFGSNTSRIPLRGVVESRIGKNFRKRFAPSLVFTMFQYRSNNYAAIRLLLFHEKVDCMARNIHLWCVQTGLTIERRIAGGKEQCIAFA